MSNVLRLAIVDPNDAQRESLKGMLLGMDLIWLEAECSRYEFFADVVAQTNPDIGLVAIDSDPEKALDLVTRLGLGVAELRRAGRKLVERRQPDFAGASGGGQGVPHSTRQDRRPAGGVGANQRSAFRARRQLGPAEAR